MSYNTGIEVMDMANPVAVIQAKAAGVAKRSEDVPDEKNPAYMFGMTHSALLVAAVRGEIDINQLVKDELANRGLNWKGEWIGFEDARLLAKCSAVRIKGVLRAVSVPE